MIDPAGRAANRNGKWMEGTIKDHLLRAGYVELSEYQKKQLRSQDGVLILNDKPAWFCQQIGLERNLYDAKFTSDFFINSPKYPIGLHIESKYQGTPGSVDEKYVFTVQSMKRFSSPSMLILDGGGSRQGAVRWMKRQQVKDKFTFMMLDEFNLWARDHLI